MAVSRSRSSRGFVLIVTSIAMTFLIAVAGLAVDIGRMYVIRAELQSFTDAAALAAALELDGSESGLARARSGAARFATGPHAMRWDMSSQAITHITTSFSTDQKTWQDQPPQFAYAKFVRVSANESAPVIFLRLFQPLSSATVAAQSVAANGEGTARLVQ